MDKQSFWILRYGDYEIFHTMQFKLQREVRRNAYHTLWSLRTTNASVKFTKDFEREYNNYILVHANGEIILKVI